MLALGPLTLGIRLESDANGQPVVTYVPRVEDFTPPTTREERIEWVRQSYERFFEKVLEKDTLTRVAEVG